MSVDADEVRALAHAFARTLEHLREFRGLTYVGSAPMPASDEADVGPEAPAGASDHATELEPPVAAAADTRGTAAAPDRPLAQRRELEPAAAEAEQVRRPRPREQQSPPPPRSRPAAPPRQTDLNRPTQQSTYSREHQQSSASANHSGATRPEPTPPGLNSAVGARASAGQWPAAKKLAYLRERNVGDCQRCPLARTRRNIVFGVGNPEADVMFIGEAPGGQEDRLGEPFVGAAGRRLDQWIAQLGMSRGDVYIANVLKCRPPGNRDPQSGEIERCSPFLHAQIRAIEPKVLIALGRFAGCLLLGRELKLWEMRGKVHGYREPKSGVEVPLFVTYHPAYVLRCEQRPRTPRPGQARPDRGGAIKSEDEKVLADLARAVSLVGNRV